MRLIPPSSFVRRAALGLGAALCLIPALAAAQTTTDAAAWRALKNDGIVLFRHANAPGTGDPPGFKLDDCSTQRNLDADGQAQALRIGKAFESRGVKIGAVWSSAWCRAKVTGELAFPGRLRLEPAFNSFFSNPSLEPLQTRKARELLLSWKGPGALVVVTHQVNISALTSVAARPGEGMVLEATDGKLETVGRIQP